MEVETASICIGVPMPGWTPDVMVMFGDNSGVGALEAVLDTAGEVERDLGSKFGTAKGTVEGNTCRLAVF
jgi:hypothetical protein